MTRKNGAGITRRGYLKGFSATGFVGLTGLAGATQDRPLEVLHGWTGGDGKAAIDALTETFAESHSDMATDFRPIGGGGNENLDAVVAQRLSNRNPPSAFAGWPGANLQQYEGVLGNIEGPVWDQAGLKGAHVEEAQQACQFGDGYAAVPIGSHRLNNLFYNVSVVEEAGITPDDISNLDGLFDAMDAVDENTDAVPMAHAKKAPWTTLQLWAVAMLGQEGYQPYMDYIEGNGDEGAVRRSFETTQQILENYINEDASSIGFTTANQKLMNGEAAFIHQGNWVAGAYRNNDLTYDEDWGWTAFPGTDGMYGFHLDSFIYPRPNPTSEKAYEWLRFVGSREAHVTFNPLKGSIPTRTDVSSDDFGPYLSETMEDFANADQKPPTLAHGLAVPPETLNELKGVIANEFSGPYNIDAATQGMLQAVQ